MLRILCLAAPLALLGACGETDAGEGVPHALGASADSVEAYGAEGALMFEEDADAIRAGADDQGADWQARAAAAALDAQAEAVATESAERAAAMRASNATIPR